ncbi:MAG TPA: nickel pincer cofactor biosynthesis protein LarC [Candidatus Binataceae bacterium]|nr:nickel pincer cofactor biosynthesis protein LarC [Candidatus Binataceae bacterium]
MAETAYLDAFSGLSGDMLLGALLDAGLDLRELEHALASLRLSGYRISSRRRELSGISAVKFDVEVLEPQPERTLVEIRTLIEQSQLAPAVKETAIAAFVALAEAEAKVHHSTPEHVHFHEVGAVDSIIDIVGAAWGFAQLKVSQVLVSPLPMGTGFVNSRHGRLPVPAPATVELLAGFPVKLGDGRGEMVTPTGAALMKVLALPGALPLTFEVDRIGYGAGSATFDDRPNVLRLMLGKEASPATRDEIVEIATNIDDLNPQMYDYVCERLFAAGAYDVVLTPMIMKKGRPAITLSVLAEPSRREAIAEVLFAETTTIGVRFHPVGRLKLEREIKQVETPWGAVRIKISRRGNRIVNLSPEYEDCRRIAAEHSVALKVVTQEAHDAARRQLS